MLNQPRLYKPATQMQMSLGLIRLNRFPVPQDNFVPVATSSKCLLGR